MADASRDQNFVPTLLGVSSADGTSPVKVYADPVTHRLMVDIPGTTGSVTSVSVVTANGFAGSVANPTTTPAITLSTTLGAGQIPVSNGTGFQSAPLTGTGNIVLATSPTFSGATITTSTVNGVTLTTGGSATTFLNGAGAYTTPTAGTGDVVGPASATDNAIARFDLTTGKLIQNSVITIADTTGNMAGVGTVNTLTLPASNFVGLTDSQALTNKDLTSGTNTFPTFNQNTSGSAATLTTPRTIGIATGDATSAGSAFNGSANNTNALTLATVNSNVGSFGSATQTGTFTVNGKGLTTAASNVTITPAVGSITGLGTGVATALAINVGSAGAPVLFNGAGGTPSSLTLTNATGLPVAGGGTGVATFTAYSVICAGTTSTGAFQNVSGVGTSGQVLTSNGASALPTWQTVGAGVATSSLPAPVNPIDPGNTSPVATRNVNTNTEMLVGQIIVPQTIVVNLVTFTTTTAGTAGTLDVSLYSNDGQTRLFSVTTASISGAATVSTAVSAVTVAAGTYYIGVNSNGTAAVTVNTWGTENLTLAGGLGGASKAIIEGNQTITAGTPPATITPNAITTALTAQTLAIRLDT